MKGSSVRKNEALKCWLQSIGRRNELVYDRYTPAHIDLLLFIKHGF